MGATIFLVKKLENSTVHTATSTSTPKIQGSTASTAAKTESVVAATRSTWPFCSFTA